MATLQEYMNRRNAMSSSYDKYLQGTPRAKTKSFWQEEDVATALYRQRREMEERREASRREMEEQIRRAQQRTLSPTSQQLSRVDGGGSDAGFLEKTGETVIDIFGNILSGASKALEGVFDLGISGVGAIGGVFDKGFRDEMRRWVEYDVTGQHVQSTFDRWSDDSILNNSKAGQITENVLRGVGQMLPTVAVSIATGGAALPAMLAVGASAAGNATEEAWQDGADYYRGLGYGVVSGGVEMLTEKALGGLGGIIGPGYLDNVVRSVATRTAATGARRVLKEAAGEAVEEAVAELVNPLAKTIYKGRDALDDYSKAEYWQGVGESALVGGLTSAAYGGTVGRAMKASGKYGDVRETVADINANRKKRANLHSDGKWTDAREDAFHKREVANYRQIEQILQSATPKQRATMIKQNELGGVFDADGTLRTDFLRSLGENVIDGRTDTQGGNVAQRADFHFEEGKESKSQDLVDFYQSVLSMKDNAVKNKRKKKIGVVTQEHATLVSDLIKKETGKSIDLSDYEIWINGSAVNHIEDRHGKNGVADKSMADMDNVARIPWALDNATSGEVLKKENGNLDLDYNHKNGDGSPSVKIRISKEVDNGLLFVAECAPDANEKKLHILSAYMQQKSSEGQELTHKTQSLPQPTSETVLDSNTATDSIPQNSDLSTASGEKGSGNFDHRYMSPDLWHRQSEVQREIAKISQDSGENVSILSRDLSDEGKKQHTRLKKAFSTLSELSGGKLQMVVVEENNKFTGAYAQGDTVYISADAVESGTWGEALIEESTHFAQGTQEHGLLRAFLAGDTELLSKVESELTKEGNTYGFTAEDAEAFRAYLKGDSDTELTGRALQYSNEVTAHMSAELLSNEAVIDRLVGANATLAEKILIKFKQLKRAFSKDKSLTDRVATAESLYLKAIERRGWRYVDGKIVGADDELDNEGEIGYNKKQNFEQGGKSNGTESIEQSTDGQTDTDRIDAESDARTLPKNENGGGVSKESGESEGIHGQLLAGFRGGQRGLNSAQLRFSPDCFVEPKSGTVEGEEYAKLATYGIEGYVVKKSAWTKNAQAFANGGRIYIRENIDEKYRGIVVAHEATHVMKQLQFQPYLDFVDRTPTMLNMTSTYTRILLEHEAKHINVDLFTMNDAQRDRLYDEINASIYGHYAAGQIVGEAKENFHDAFLDFDAYIRELDAIHKQFQVANAENNENKRTIDDEIYYSRKGEANQQTSDDFSNLLASAGIKGEAVEIRGDLEELYRIAKDTDSKQGEEFVKRVANRIAMEMARKGKAQNGETQDEMTDRMYREILAGTDIAESGKDPGTENRTDTEKQASKDEPKPKKTGYTYDDVHSMLDELRKGSFQFETPSGVIEGRIFRKDDWDISKRIYEVLKTNEQSSKRELAKKISELIVDTVKVNEKGADGKTVARRLSERLGKDGTADAKESIAIDVAAILGDRDAKKYNKRMGDLKYAAQQLSDMKKGRYVNAANYKGDTFKVALSELARMNWRGGLVSAGKLRERFAALARWYTPNNPLYGSGGEANENYRRSIAEALDFLSDTSRGAFTIQDIDAAEMIVKYFKREIENYGTVFKNGKRVEAEPLVKEYISKIEHAKRISEKSSILQGILRNPLARLAADPAMLMREADSYLEGGFFSEQFEELRRGTIDAAVLEHELTSAFVSFWEKNKEYAKRYNGTEIKYGDKTIPLQEAMSLYMTMRREHAFAGLAYAGFEIEGKKGTVNVSDGFADLVEKYKIELMNKLPPEKALTMKQEDVSDVQTKAIEQAVSHMREGLYRQFTAEDKRLISIMEQGYESCREVKTKNDNILMGYSNVVGTYYYPVKRAGLAENVDITSMFEGDRVSNLSFNKDTVKNAHKLLIEPAHIVFMRHVKAMSLYDGLGVFTDNFNRLYNLNVGESANNAITIRSKLAQANRFVKDMMPYFKELKQDVEGISKKRSSERFYNDAVAMIRSTYATYQLGFNPKTWFSQMSSLIASTIKVDMSSLMSGFHLSGQDVDDYCKLAWLRNNDGDAVLAQSVTSGLNPVQMASRNALQKVRDVSMLPIGKVDRFVIEKLFAACQVQVEKKQGLKLGSEKNKIEAGKLLEQVILETQQNSLATERTAAMRSGDEMLKGFNMFIADAMKVQARMIEPYAKMSSLRTQRRMATDAGDAAEVARIDGKIEEMRKECARATAVLIGVAVFNALLAYGFKWLYRKDEEEDVKTVVADVVGNMIGGIPFVRDAYTFLVDGFEMDNFAISTFNDVLKATADTVQLLQEAAQGREVTKQESMRAIRNALYTVGQLSGVPVRNLYNNVTGIINRISPEAQYRMEDLFYKQSYSKDLQAAIDADDGRMISLVASMMLEDSVGDVDKALGDGLRPLVEAGYDVLPRAVGDSITYDGEEIVLTKRQRKRFKEVYGVAEEQVISMMALRQYKEADDEVRARAIKLIWEAYYGLAVDDMLGVDSAEKNVLFAEAIDMDKLALIIATARSIKADVGANGKAINGSRLAKIEKYVESLKLKAAQKYMVMGYLGYKNRNGEDKVRAYINTLSRLSREEKQALLEYSGYAA